MKSVERPRKQWGKVLLADNGCKKVIKEWGAVESALKDNS